MLAHVEKIHSFEEIEGADFIIRAKVLDWPVVVKKGDFQEGDKVVFVEPDTTIPRREWNKFLWPKKDPNPEGERIRLRCAKFKGQTSMGLVISVSNLEGEFEEGADVAEILNIEKYEMPLNLGGGNAKGNFPNWLRKSDENNIFGAMGAFYELKGLPAYFSIKQDGSSAKFSFKDGMFQLFSRRLEVSQEDESAWTYISKKYDLERKLRDLNLEIALCGELCGPKMNGNKMGLKELDFFLYDVWDIQEQKYLNYDEMMKIAEIMEIPTVPLWKLLDKFDYESISVLQNEIDQEKYPNGEWIEGVVVRPTIETYSVTLKGRLSWKLINSNFAAKHL